MNNEQPDALLAQLNAAMRSMPHVDDFIDGAYTAHDDAAANYARFFLMLKRLPAGLQRAFDAQIRPYRLFCTHAGVRWRCTGASRMGDVWLAADPTQEHGYDERVNIATCSDWSATP